MGGTSLVTKGMLGPIEGDVVQHHVVLPLKADYLVQDMDVSLPNEIRAEIEMPNEIFVLTETMQLESEVEVPELNVEIELEC